jgi:hypothetical protein
MDPEAFVDNLDGMASAAFSNVTEEVIPCVLRYYDHFYIPLLGPLRHRRSVGSAIDGSHRVVPPTRGDHK